jgi:hypothetical protein
MRAGYEQLRSKGQLRGERNSGLPPRPTVHASRVLLRADGPLRGAVRRHLGYEQLRAGSPMQHYLRQRSGVHVDLLLLHAKRVLQWGVPR